MTTSDPAGYFVGPDHDPDKYRLLQQVGRGGEAELWQAELSVDGGAEPVAIKMQRDDRRDPRSAQRWSEQAELLRFVSHPGVVGVRESFDGARMHPQGGAHDASGRVLCLVMNWVDGMPLDEWAMVNRTAPDRLSRVLRHLGQAATVLDWLHSGEATPSQREVIHGDLSPRNIMIRNSGQAVLVDFGMVRLVSHETSRAAGTPGYAAPEVWHAGRYSTASDRFSFGAIGYYALTGEAPPQDPGQVRAGLGRTPLLTDAAPARVDRLMAVFSPRPQDRPSATEWVHDLRQTALSSTAPPSQGRVSTYVPAAVGADGGGRPPAAPWTPQPGPPRRPDAAGSPPPDPGRQTRPPRRWRRTKATAAVIVLLAVLGGGIYLGSRFAGGDGSDGRAAPATTSTPAPTTAPSDGSTPPTLDPTAVQIRRETGNRPITLTDNYSVDIDSLADNWDVSTSSTEKDLSLSSGRYLSARNGSDFAPAPNATPDFATCQAATGYGSQLDLTNDQPRTSYCLRTSQNRYALITLENAEEPLVIDVTVWDPPLP